MGDGLGYCDCQEGWLRYEGRCYQEFTPAFCLGRDQILTFQPPSSLTVFPGEGKKLYIEGLKHNFSCQRNPCEPSYLPHTLTWSTKSYCHAVKSDSVAGCELFVTEPRRNLSELECCLPSQRSHCYLNLHNNGFELLSLTPFSSKCGDKYGANLGINAFHC